eukprot:TRINITY_DN31858_c0_g1_i1.p1 TRINITY_DN31858_c0_g1~~TRINITY_DN31858_c0_g1_i1.p1  ORF type:complete len:829 (-),score=181.12 TRINITY_DN31858_c0_g1_i1:103-2589(-)
MADTLAVNDDDDLSVPAGIVYNRPPAHKRRPVAAAEPKTPTLLRDISGSGAGSAPSRSAKRKGTLTKISEAAEWADESTRADSKLDDELEAVWADAGLSGAAGAGHESSLQESATAGLGTSSSNPVGGGPSQQKAVASSSISSALVPHADDLSEEEDAFQVEVIDSPVAAKQPTSSTVSSQAAETVVTKMGPASDSESSDEASSDEGEAAASLPSPARAKGAEVEKRPSAELSASKAANNEAFEMEFLDLDVDDVRSVSTRTAATSLQSAPPASKSSDFEDFSPEKVRPVEAKQEPAQPKPKASLLDMMTFAVQSVEQEPTPTKQTASTAHGPVSQGSSLVEDEPEVAGLELEIDDADVAKFSHGSAAALLTRTDGLTTNAVAGRKPKGRIVGRTDAFEEAIKKSSAGTSAASTSPALGAVGLTGLRKNIAGAAPHSAGSTAASTKSTAASAESTAVETVPAAQAIGSAQPSLADIKTITKTTTAVDSQETREDGDGDDAALLDEWEEIGRKTEEFAAAERANRGVAKAQQDVLSQPIAYAEVHKWLVKIEVMPDVLRPLEEEEAEDTRCGCMSRRRSLTDVPGLDRKLVAEKDLVLFLKMTHFDFNDTTHHRMLRTIYSKLARAKVCPTVGRHWEVLGFQGGDPKTDLNRSCGVLNVLQMFFFFSHHFDLLKSAYLLAQDSEQNFPLACVGINITRMVIDCLLRGRLSKLCNANQKGVFDAICTVYCGGLFHFYHRWRTQKRTIRHTELTFNEVRDLMEKRPAKLIEGLHKGAGELKAKSDASRLEFTDLDFGARAPQAPKGGGSGGGAALIPKRLRNYQDGKEGGD